MNRNAIRRTLRAGIAAAAVSAVAILGLAAPAQAAPLVDPDEVGSIAVHKFERDETPTGLVNNGTEVDTTGLTPVPGVEFQVQQVVGIDLSTNAGWGAASGLSTSFDAADPQGSIEDAGYSLGAAEAQTTDANGDALFPDLPVGLYLVEETVWPSGATPSAPFLVTIPLTDPVDEDTWLYNVHVYPKNSITEATKTVNDADATQLGDEVTFTITSDIPNEEIIDGFKIVDPLDSKLDYVSTSVTLANGTPIVLDTDFTVVHDVPTNTVTVEFTEAGRTILAANNATSVVANVVTTVNTVGEIENTALVYPNAASFDIDPGEPGGPPPTPPVETRWGGVTIEKVDPSDNPLTGAVFQVFTSEADALALTSPVSIDGETSFEVVDVDGTLTISGLRYSDFANGSSVAPGDAGYIQYYLVETVAPEGYELLAEPIAFTVTADSTAGTTVIEVENVLHNAGFELPLTGGAGTGMLYAVGLVLIAGGVLFLLRRRVHRTA